MIRTFPAIIVALALFSAYAQKTSASTDSVGTPRYISLYEDGFYAEAIAVLDSLISLDPVPDPGKLYHLAACHIAGGNRDSGAAIFETLLKTDSTYDLDTLYTPPKILVVFREVQSKLNPVHASYTTKSAASPSSGVAAAKNSSDTTTLEKNISLPVAADTPRRHLHSALAVPPGLLPLGLGQFLQRKPARGALFCAAQTTALILCAWSFSTREGYRDPAYGWTDGNREAYDRYTQYTRSGAGLFLATYAFSITDYFFRLRKMKGSQ
jgi:hypothetical protein